MGLAALGAVGLAVLALVGIVAAALVLFLFTIGNSEDLTLPLCEQAKTSAQCWGAGSDGTLVVTYGELTATDPGYDDEPRTISREQALDELNIHD